MCRLHLDLLESRLTPNAYRWVGGGQDQKWSTKENWYDDTLHSAPDHAPQVDDDVTFTTQSSSTIDLGGVRSVTISYGPTDETSSVFTVSGGGLSIDTSLSIAGLNHFVKFQSDGQSQNPIITAGAYEESWDTYAPLTVIASRVSFKNVDLQIGSVLDPTAGAPSTISTTAVPSIALENSTFTNLSKCEVYGADIQLKPSTSSASFVNEQVALMDFYPSSSGTRPDIDTTNRGAGNTSTVRNSGTVRIHDAPGLAVEADLFDNKGLVQLNAGSKLNMTSTEYVQSESWAVTRIQTNGTIISHLANGNNNTLKITAGLLEGSGSIQADVQIGSATDPNMGASLYVGFSSPHGTGTISISGKLSVNQASQTTFEINGTDNFSKLRVTGTSCTMSGTLRVLKQEDYQPSDGTFGILECYNFTNNISNYDLPTWFVGAVPYHFEVSSDPTSGLSLTVMESD